MPLSCDCIRLDMQEKKPTPSSINLSFVDPSLNKDFFYKNIDAILERGMKRHRNEVKPKSNSRLHCRNHKPQGKLQFDAVNRP